MRNIILVFILLVTNATCGQLLNENVLIIDHNLFTHLNNIIGIKYLKILKANYKK